MSSCLGYRKKRDEDHEPLLPVYKEDTDRQKLLHEKLHTYQELRALTKGYMPSNEQLIVNLRTLLAADLLRPDESVVSDSGRLLAKYTGQWLKQFIDLLQHKNSQDQLQDFIWFLTKSRITLDAEDLARRASYVKSKADTRAAYESFKTVGSLLLTNSDFRVFLSDLQVIGREIFGDTAKAVSKVADKVGDRARPSADHQLSTVDSAKNAPTGQDLAEDVNDLAKTVQNGAVEVGSEARDSVQDHFSGQERDTLVRRLKVTISKLRYRRDYSDSVSIIALLIKRYALAYSKAVEKTVETAQEDTDANAEMMRTVENFWALLTSFGSKADWEELERRWKTVAAHQQRNPDFEGFMVNLGNSIQKLLTDPDSIDNLDSKLKELQSSTTSFDSESSIRHDLQALLDQVSITVKSVAADKDIAALTDTTLRIAHILSPQHSLTNQDLLTDTLQTFLPILISSIQHVPIPRLELLTPALSLLLENVIIQPGQTKNASSFLPFRARLTTQNDTTLHKNSLQHIVSSSTTNATLRLDGISVAAQDTGYVLRMSKWPLSMFNSSGIASLALDNRGMDIQLDLSMHRALPDSVLSLRAVKVQIHRLNVTLRKSALRWPLTLLKPLLLPILRKTLEVQIAKSIAEALHALNRELVFARERLRATRVAEPQDVATFIRAVAARWTPEENPDLEVAVGIWGSAKSRGGPFQGVYAPGSVVKVWETEGRRAGEVVDDESYSRQGWRNDIFDIVQGPNI